VWPDFESRVKMPVISVADVEHEFFLCGSIVRRAASNGQADF
jgi:hypothetical protein